MSFPDFPSLPKGLKFSDSNAKNCLLVYYDKTQEWKGKQENLLLSIARDMYREMTNGCSSHEREHWSDHLEDEIKQYFPRLYDFLSQFPISELTNGEREVAGARQMTECGCSCGCRREITRYLMEDRCWLCNEDCNFNE